ncbi:beta-lactamase/transpeptidase-like protein [Exidia glandulosa HHB12029]|uniref:Beta-lactamase/transpeptidase-like protein n=1 Tax=Exidia glandulosa HHB12029 TaxID=1314781 RepID=A0A165KW29_EXIGL|nr:beta-lactamase/transpeptidase-like protein [Exidia glandulosa HHB12029]
MSISLASWLPDSSQLLALLPNRDAVFAATRFESPPVARIHVRNGDGDELLTPAIDAFIKETLTFWNVTGGAAVAIVRRRADGSGAFDVATRGYGAAAQDGTPMTTETLLPIGSNSKLFCASSVGLLVSNSSVDLDWTSKVHQVLPEFALQDPVATERADLVDILSHRTGLPRHDFALSSPSPGKDPENFSLRSVKHLKMSAEFRQTWQYNNHMYNIGASLVANLSGVPYKDFVQEHLFDAAGLSSATLGLTAAAKDGKLAQGFFTVGENSTYPGQAFANYVSPGVETFVAGAGAVAASANDIALWLQVLLSGGKSPKTGRQVIPAEVLQKLEAGVMAVSPAAAPELSSPVYGLALISASYQGHQYIEHGGALTGYLSQITRFPNEGLGIAVLTNESPRGAYVHEAVKWRIAEELLGLPLRVDWNAR